MTAKGCTPMIDAMSLGFVIPLFGDTNIRTDEDCSNVEVGGNPYGPIIEFHSRDQVGGIIPGDAIKFINRIIVKTPPGVSTLFLPLPNSLEKRFTCFAALVDTDTYTKEINFPAIWHEPNHDAILKAGTPLVVAIPIKRSMHNREAIVRQITHLERHELERITRCMMGRRNVYVKELRGER